MKLIQKLKEYYINFYKKFLFEKSGKRKKESVFYKSSTTKRSMNSGATLKLSTVTEQKKSEILSSLEPLMKKYIKSPQKLMDYMKKEGMSIYIIKNSEKFLSKINEQEGFITPLKGRKAFILNLFIGMNIENKLNIKLKTKEMFIFSKQEQEIYTLARALYKYYGYKNNLPGFDYKSQEMYKKIYKKDPNQKSLFGGFSLEDMYSCKEAMARDIESINFAIKLSEDYAGSKKVLQKIKDDNSANI